MDGSSTRQSSCSSSLLSLCRSILAMTMQAITSPSGLTTAHWSLLEGLLPRLHKLDSSYANVILCMLMRCLPAHTAESVAFFSMADTILHPRKTKLTRISVNSNGSGHHRIATTMAVSPLACT